MTASLPSKLSELVDEKKYQKIVADMLAIAKQKGAEQAEVAAYFQQGLSINVRQQKVETLEFNRDKAVGITVYIDKRKGSVSTTDISQASIESAVQKAIDLAKYTEKDDCAGLADREDLAKHYPDLKLYHPWDVSIEECIESTKECEQSALSYDKRISNSEGASFSSNQGYHIHANSEGFMGSYPTSRHSLSCVVIAKGKDNMVRDYDYTVSRKAESLEAASLIGKSAAKRTVDRMDARKIPTGKVSVIYDAHMAQSLIGSFLGAISGGPLFRKTSFLLDSMGKQIFPSHISLEEKPHLLEALGSAPYDSNGVATRDKFFLKEGIVENYVLGAYSARKLKMKNTGNAGGVHNLHITTSNQNLASLCKEMGTGLLVTELMGQGVNMVTGDYSRGASGYWIENGEIQFPVHEVTVAANLKDVFKNIVKVGNDIDRRGNILTGSILIESMMVAGT